MSFYLLPLWAIRNGIIYIKDTFKLWILFKLTNKYIMFYSIVGDDKVNGDDDDDGMRTVMKKFEKRFKKIGVVYGGRVH